MKTISVATTINPRFDHVTPIESTHSEVTITHRCHVMAELLAVGRSGLVDVVLVASDLDLVSLETLQQLQGPDGAGPRMAAISDVADERQRLIDLGIPVASPQLSGPELVEWLQDPATHHEPTGAAIPEKFSAQELRFLAQVDPDNKTSSTMESVDKLTPKRRSGRRAAPYDPTTDMPEEPHADATAFAPTDFNFQTQEPPVQEVVGEQPVEEHPVARPADDQLDEASSPDEYRPAGNLTAVWGPIGAPGVTTLAVNMAVESALGDQRTLLIDADTYGAAVAVHLGLLDDTAAIAQACRAAEHRGIDANSLAHYAQSVAIQGTRVDVVTGLTRSERWPQVRAAAWEQVLAAARNGWDQVIIDCGFGLEEDEELSFDIPAPQRNATTVSAVRVADTVVAVGAGDPVGFVRFMKALEHLTDVTTTQIIPVVNKVAAISSGISPKQQLAGVWERFGPALPLNHFLPWAPEVTARALLRGKAIAEAAPKADLRTAIAKLAKVCCPVPVAATSPANNVQPPQTSVKPASTFSFRKVVGTMTQRIRGNR